MNGLRVKHNNGILLQDFPGAMLFNRNEYLRLFKNYEIHQFSLEDQHENILAQLSLAVYGKTAFNPLLAPFGGIEIIKALAQNELTYFLQEIIKETQSIGLQCIRVSNFPEAFDYSTFKSIEGAFNSVGFARVHRQPDWVFFLEEFKLLKNEDSVIGCEFIYDEEFDLKEIFEFLTNNRIKQGYEFRLGFDDFYGFLNALPEYHALFVLRENGKLLAVMTGVLVTNKIMYAFPAAYDPENTTLDQILFFYQSLFEMLKENGFRIFDTGTVFNDQDRLIFSQLGAIKTYKNTFELQW